LGVWTALLVAAALNLRQESMQQGVKLQMAQEKHNDGNPMITCDEMPYAGMGGSAPPGAVIVGCNHGCGHQDDAVNTQSDWILVPDGGGVAQHFTDVQHVKFAMTLTHPLALNANLNTSEEWWSAVKFETKSCHKVDAFKLQLVAMDRSL
jgi:hypothetical protein